AAVNGPQQTVVSGDADKLDLILTECECRGISSQPLNVSHAFHSPLMEPILTQFLDRAAKVSFASPNIELMCNLSGEFADLNEMLTPEYWMRHIREAVNFHGCIERLLEQGYDCFLEIGPAPVLCAMGQVVGRHLDRDVRWIPTLRRPRLNDQSEARRQIQLAIAGTYCAGVDLDWSAVQGGKAPRRIALPNYPFEPKWFWPEGDSARHEDALPSGSPLHALLNESDTSSVSSLLGRLSEQGCVSSSQQSVAEQVLNQLRAWHSVACEYGDLDDWFYELCWESSKLPGVPMQRPTPSHWLVLRDSARCSMAEQVQRALEQADHSVSVVETGHLKSSEIEEFLADVLPTIPPVDHCLLLSHWSADGYGADGSDTNFDAIRSQSVDLLLVLAQRFEQTRSAARVWIPTVQVWDVERTEPGIGHLHSPLWIMMRNLYREMPHRVGAVLDMERGAPACELVDAIHQLVGAESQHEYQWLLRGDQAFVPRLQAAPSLPSGRARHWNLDSDARYLVTGPFGGIGLALSQLLVDRGARHLCLVSRSGPVAEDAATAVQRWRDSGVEVDTPMLDVADPAAVAELFSAMDDRHPLRGVLHTAGTTADGMLEDLTPADFERVLRPKMIGTGLLDEHTRSIPLDFFVCFSSTSALLGAPGLANYASANFYMDALMAERRRLGLAGFSIQWGTWAEVGMVAKLGQTHLKRQAAQGWRLIGTANGIRALERIMIASQSGLPMPDTPIVMPVADWSRVLTVLGGRQDAQFARLAERFGNDDDLESGVDEAVAALLALPREEQRAALTQKLKSKIAIGFGFDAAELSVDESLVSLGMDSLLAVQLKMALQKMLGVDLPMEVLLQGASISEIAAHVLRHLPSPEDARANSLDSARRQEQVSIVL
ncbi:MAG: type I polyketide synthase, partial [Pseudomonadota bacterium]